MTEDKKPTVIKKSIDRPFYGSTEQPMRESISAPTPPSMVSGKPRPKPTDE